MEMMFLILKFRYGSVIIPEKYPKQECHIIGNAAQEQLYIDKYYCIPAPNPNMLKDGCIVGNNKIDCPSLLKKEQ